MRHVGHQVVPPDHIKLCGYAHTNEQPIDLEPLKKPHEFLYRGSMKGNRFDSVIRH